MSTSLFTVGGPVGPKNIYVAREADDELLEACLNSEYCSILTARQMGKSSLMNRTIRALLDRGVRALVVDLQPVGTKSLAESYKDIIGQILRKLKLDLGLLAMWDRDEIESLPQRFRNFLRDVVLDRYPEQIVIFMDEIERIKQLEPRDAGDFFSVLRGMYNERANPEETSPFSRLTFVLIGMLRPEEIIPDVNLTPFNIGKRINLVDFNANEVLEMAQNLPNLGIPAEQAAGWLFDWTCGQPYLTAAICDRLSRQPGQITNEGQFLQAVADLDIQFNSLHLAYVRDYVVNKGNRPDLNLRIYGLILRGVVIKDAQDEEISILKLSGIIKTDSLGALMVRNLIVEQALNPEWVIKELKKKAAVEPENFDLAKPFVTVLEDVRERAKPLSPEHKLERIADSAVEEPEWLRGLRSENQFQQATTPSVEEPAVEKDNEGTSPASGLLDEEFDIDSILTAGFEETGKETGEEKEKFGILKWVRRIGSRILQVIRPASSRSVLDYKPSAREVNRAVRDISSFQLRNFLVQANVPFTWTEALLICLVFVLALSAVIWKLSHLPYLAAFFYSLLLFPFMGILLYQRRKIRLEKIAIQLPDAISQMVNGLRAGYSTLQAIESGSKELDAPIADEFRRVIQNMQLGVPMEASLQEMLDRAPDVNLEYMISAINIQREVGGNLAEILDTISFTIRESRHIVGETRLYNILPFRLFFAAIMIIQIVQWTLAPSYFAKFNSLSFTNIPALVIYFLFSLVLTVSALANYRLNGAVANVSSDHRLRNIAGDLILGAASLVAGWLLGVPFWVLIWLSIFLLARFIQPLGNMLLTGLALGLILIAPNFIHPVQFILGTTPKAIAFGNIVSSTIQVVSDWLSATDLWIQNKWIYMLIWLVSALVAIQIAQMLIKALLKPKESRASDLENRLEEFSQRGETVSLRNIEFTVPVYTRFLDGLLAGLYRMLYRFSPQGWIDSLSHKLEQAGPRPAWRTWQFILIQVVLLGVGWTIPFVLKLQVHLFWLTGLAVSILFFYYPLVLLNAKIRSRQESLKGQLADAVDLLTISVEAGLALDAAMDKVANHQRGEFAYQLRIVIREIQLGKLRREALRDMNRRTGGVQEISYFIASVIQAEMLGVSLAKTLRIQSDQIRGIRRQNIVSIFVSMDTLNRMIFFSLFGPLILLWLLLPILDKLLAVIK